jgi:ribosome biogenesis GTPase
MNIEELGYNNNLKKYSKEHNLDAFEIGRVLLEHKDRYIIKTSDSEFEAELLGNLRFTAKNRYDYPAVGDWVAFSEYDDGKALIHAIYPRTSIIERQAVGTSGQIQIIATNVDGVLIVQAVGRDFNLNRLERYLTICYSSGVVPFIILNKIDLISKSELQSLIVQISLRIKDVPVISVSNGDKGYNELETIIEKGKTYCLLGSSGVGKSTILNNLLGEQQMRTGEISLSANKGKHVTSHRELIVLNAGGIIIDNPGMREVGIADTKRGLETTFDAIIEYAKNCRFKDCTHVHEIGCAILEAIEKGEIDQDAYFNLLKMEKEKSHFESDVAEKRKKDKDFGKMIKNVKKHRKNNKY